MRLRLAINNCFAVKRWPLADEWAQIVAGELGLDSVQHSLDLVDLGAGESEQEAQAEEVVWFCVMLQVPVGHDVGDIEVDEQ